MALNLIRRLAVAASVAVALLVPVTPAWAQLDPGNFDIRQRGSVVGHIFVPERISAAVYVEHWVVSRDYVYPSAGASVVTEIVPSNRMFATEQEFFRQVEFGPGSRYIRVLARDDGTLPKPAGPPAGASSHGTVIGVGQLLTWTLAGGGVALCLAIPKLRLRLQTRVP